MWLFVNAAYPADLALDRKRAWWWVERVCKLRVWFLDSKKVDVVGDSEVNRTGVRVSFLLVPSTNADVRCEGGRGSG